MKVIVLWENMKTPMHTKLLQYYNTETLNILNNAAFLEPRFKLLTFLEEVEKTSTQLMIQENCSLLLESDSGSDTLRTTESASISVVSNTSKDVINVTPATKRKKTKQIYGAAFRCNEQYRIIINL